MSIREFQYQGGDFVVTDSMKDAFKEDGYTFVRGLFSKEEVAHIEKAILAGPFMDHTYGVADGDGREAHMILWNHPGVDVTGMVSRCEKVAGGCEQFLGGEVYHYHTKLMKKPAKIGGKHIWHQDYGYWYNNGCLFPNMMTVFIAIDKCKKDNSCLQVLKSSHKCGRIEHVRVGNQIGRMFHVWRRSATCVPCSLWRWNQVPDSAILECQEFKDMTGKWFHMLGDENNAEQKPEDDK